VTVNNYLAVGGDGFTVLKDGSATAIRRLRRRCLYAYFLANSPIGPAPADRIVRMN